MVNQKENCIYMKGKEKLSYSSQEHIVPASLGGVKKLDRGIVSDAANSLFSKRERIALHDTLLSVNRDNNGPGKRGSYRVDRTKEPRVQLFEMVSCEYKPPIFSQVPTVQLGFLFCGEVCILDQIIFALPPDGSIKIPQIVLGSKAITSGLEKFQHALKQFSSKSSKVPGKDYKIVLSKWGKKDYYFALGLYRKKWYISSPSDHQTRLFMSLLQRKTLPQNIRTYEAPQAIYHYNRDLPKILDPCYHFLYTKTAFNVLAYFFNSDFLLDSQFDSIRAAIVQCDNFSTYFIEQQIPDWLVNWVKCNVPSQAHFIVLHGHECIIEAYVSFYREQPSHSILLSQNYKGAEFRKYFICDYKSNTPEDRERQGDIP